MDAHLIIILQHYFKLLDSAVANAELIIKNEKGRLTSEQKVVDCLGALWELKILMETDILLIKKLNSVGANIVHV